MLGLIENQEFTDYTFTVEEGGAVFVYTDGVPEAEDKEHNQFGIERMTDALNTNSDASPEVIINNVKDAIGAFIGGVAQFDDTTMLCVKRLK